MLVKFKRKGTEFWPQTRVLIALSLQPDVVDLRYFKYEFGKIKKSTFEISKVNFL